MKQNRKMNKKLNSNSGGALLSVIIVMAIVGILGALVLSVAYTNFKMKVVDRKSKNNFYTAEKVLEEVCAGLEAEASKQYNKAYTYVMSRYNGKSSTIESMEKDFNTMFVVNMVDAIKNGTDSEHYSVTKLLAYVLDAENYPGLLTVGTTKITENTNVIETLSDGLCLRNVNVTFKEGEYFNSITTDIKITTPEVGFAMISTMPEIADYSFIAEGGIAVNTGELKLNGKAYAGLGLASDKEVSVSLAHKTKFDGTGAKTSLIVSKGEIKMNGEGSFKVGNTTSLWTESLTAGANKNVVQLQGRSYVKDDTTLDGIENQLVLGGQYYGYGNDGDRYADGNSAIIINGHDSVLDMSNLNSLVLAGTSFVSTKGESYSSIKDENGNALPNGMNTDDILMGDSIAVKTNQLIYLVPTECEGIVTNPMTYEQYKTLISNTNWMDKILDTQLKSTKKKLISYGAGKVSITPVFTNRNGGVVYLYLDFADAGVASEFFMDYYGSNSEKIQTYVKNYIKSIEFSETMSRIVTRGNYLVPVTTTSNKTVTGYSGNTGNVALSTQEQTNYESSFEALCTKLITNKAALVQSEDADKTEIGKTVYVNLIDEVKIQDFIKDVQKGTVSSSVTYDSANNAVIMKTTGDGFVIVVDNRPANTKYVLPSSYENKKGIILATGDVDMTSQTLVSWKGLVICGGKLTVSNGTKTLSADEDAVGKAMMTSCDIKFADDTTGTYTVVNFFKSGKNYSIGNDGDNKVGSDIRNCITFENYKSE